jgi:hypothetical protein
VTNVRRAGHARIDGGGTITWSVADGRLGRRWRSATRDAAGRLTAALLLEIDPAGRVSKVELASPAGLLSLHPEGDLLHGNVVSEAGVHHVRLPWSRRHVLLIAGSAVADAAAAAPGWGGVGERVVVPAVIVDEALDVRSSEATFTRHADGTVVIEWEDSNRTVQLDEQAIPEALRGRGDWPLEVD